MCTKGSRAPGATPAKARFTGKPSPSNPVGAVVTDRVRRGRASGPGELTAGSRRVSSTVTAGMSFPTSLRAQQFPAGTLRSVERIELDERSWVEVHRGFLADADS